MKERIILTDVDGVTCDWNTPFTQFMCNNGYPMEPETDWFYSIPSRHNCTIEQARLFVSEFNESSRIRELQSFADSIHYVKKLKDHGFKFIAISSLGNSEYALANRTHNLNSLFDDAFAEVICLEMTRDKYSTLKRWKNTGLYWIEDHTQNAEAGYNLGLKSVLVTHPYNAHYNSSLFPRVGFKNPWEQIYDMVCKDYSLSP